MNVICSVLTSLVFYLLPAQTTLYDSSLSPVVNLPAGYFVLQSGDAPDGYIAAVYDDLTGYVKADSVTAVDYTPVNKYETTVTFTCSNDSQPVNLRSAPRRNAEIITVLDDGQSGRCYGSISGDSLFDGGGNTWYYVKTGTAKGYCYYAHVAVDATPPNIIEKEPPSTPTVTDPQDPEQKQPQTMSATAAIIFIVALCVPVPFVMFYLFRKPKDER